MTTYRKPPECRINCGGSIPPPPENAPQRPMLYICGMARYGNCPVVKSTGRARQKRLWRRFGLWRRSRREHRQRAEAMVIMLEYPHSCPDGAADLIRQRAEEIAFNEPIYSSLRQYASIPEALDQYLNAVLPLTPKLRPPFTPKLHPNSTAGATSRNEPRNGEANKRGRDAPGNSSN